MGVDKSNGKCYRHYMTYYVTITSQGQMSIPVDIRRQFGLEKSRKAIVRADGDKIVVEPVVDILSLRGVFKTKKRVLYKKVREAFGEYLARRST